VHLINIGGGGQVFALKSATALILDRCKSDIDIIVEFEPETKDLYTLKNNLRREIQTQFNTKVDVCRLKYIKPVFQKQIQSEVKYV